MYPSRTSPWVESRRTSPAPGLFTHGLGRMSSALAIAVPKLMAPAVIAAASAASANAERFVIEMVFVVRTAKGPPK